MKKQELFLLVALLITSLFMQAQQSNGNPFARLGYKASVATFGEDEEFHDQQEVVEIGSVLFNTRTNEVVGLVEERDSLTELSPEIISISIDPHCEKYYSVTPYAYCMNNPVNCIDPDGKDVIALDEESKRNIINTLTKGEAKFIRFNKDGTLNVRRLNKSKSESENITALKALANSDTKYKFQVAKEDVEGQAFSLDYKGLTAIPGEENKPSPDNDVLIQSSSFLDEKGQTMNVAHEAYGHAYFYELGKTDKSYDYQHRYKSVMGEREWDSEFNMYVYPSIRTETNWRLKKQIEVTTKQAGINYDSRKKK